MSKSWLVIYPRKLEQCSFGDEHPLQVGLFADVLHRLQDLEHKGSEKGNGGASGKNARPSLGVKLQLRQPRNLTMSDLDLVHHTTYVAFLEELDVFGGHLSGDTPVYKGYLKDVLAISGGALDALSILDPASTDTHHQGAVVIGGGQHHAARHRGGGFCFVNDMAIAAQHALNDGLARRVMIVDTDAHAGEGTMDIFYRSDEVLFVSIHQDPRMLYPNTGFMRQVGQGAGEGFTVNIPVPPMTGDEQWLRAMNTFLDPLMAEFKPDLVIRNGGSDPHWADKLTDMAVTSEGLYKMGRHVSELASKHGAAYMDLIASGYEPLLTPFLWLSQIVGAVSGPFELVPSKFDHMAPDPEVTEEEMDNEVIEPLKKILSDYWSMF